MAPRSRIEPLDDNLAPYLDELPGRLRSILCWRLHDRLTRADIAQHLNLTEPRVAQLETQARRWLRTRYERQHGLRPSAPYADVAREREASRRVAAEPSMVFDCGKCGAEGSVAFSVGGTHCRACGAGYVGRLESGAAYVPLVGSTPSPAVHLDLPDQTCGLCGSCRVVLRADADTAWRICLECGALSLSEPWRAAP